MRGNVERARNEGRDWKRGEGLFGWIWGDDGVFQLPLVTNRFDSERYEK